MTTADRAADDPSGDTLDQGDARERQGGRRRGRRQGGPSVVTISWRDIPAQLTARVGGEQHKVLLHARFQHAIDRAAGFAGLTSTDDYVQQWRTAPTTLPGTSDTSDTTDVAQRLDRLCAEIEAAYPRDRLEALVANGGLDPDAHDPIPDPIHDDIPDRIHDDEEPT